MKNKKRLIKHFNFVDPNWVGISSNILKLSKKDLSKEEGYLLDGIKLAWLASVGRDYLYKKTASGILATVAIIILTLMGYGLITQLDNSFVKSVDAKTVTTAVEELVQATMSAVFQ